MFRILTAPALVFALASPGQSSQTAVTPATPTPAAQAPSAPVKATPQNAASFMGDWVLSGDGPAGPVSLSLSLKAQGAALTVAMASADGSTPTVTDTSVAGTSLAMNVTFYNAGNEYPSLVTLTTTGDKTTFHIDVAGGLAQIDGTATKKKS